LPKEKQQEINPRALPRGGNAHTPNATGSTDRQGHGASFRMIADLSDWDKTLLMNSPGQSGDPRSPFYSNLFPLWAADQYFPGYFTRAKIKSVTKTITLLLPGK
jgi:penicillin G amidase